MEGCVPVQAQLFFDHDLREIGQPENLRLDRLREAMRFCFRRSSGSMTITSLKKVSSGEASLATLFSPPAKSRFKIASRI